MSGGAGSKTDGLCAGGGEGVVARLAVGEGVIMSGLYVRGCSSGEIGCFLTSCGVLELYATGNSVGIGGSGSSAKSALLHEMLSEPHWLTVRLYTLEERLPAYNDGVLDRGGEPLDARLVISGRGGSGFWYPKGGVLVMKL